MSLHWRNLDKELGGGEKAIAIVECCPEGSRQTPHPRVIFAKVPRKDQKRGQPPYRYRCIDCGPTQEDFQ